MQSRSQIKVSLCLGFIALSGMTTQAAMAQGGAIVISQLFGGGGQTVASPNGDFIELFNRSCVAVNLDGYSVQVASGGGGTIWNVIPLPNFQLDPGKYYCIRLETTATGNFYTHDQLAGLSAGGNLLLSSSGKAAIVLGDTPLPVADCPTSPNLVDFVKYQSGSTACTEGGSLGATLGLGKCPSRRPDVNGDGVGDGCQDTNVNSADFMVDFEACVPRNNATPTNLCPGAPVFGGCNLETGACIVTANAADCAALGGNYLGDCTPCVAPQACCLPTTPATCVVESELECQIDGGVFNPGQFSCPPPPFCPALGRCCSPDGSCVVTFEVLCVSPNTYGGDGTNCNGTLCQGRCCGLDGSCTVVGPALCVTPNTFAGVGTNCDQPQTCQGRCCEPDGDCTLTGSTNCLAPNTFGGVGTTCEDLHTFGNPDPPTVTMPPAGSAPPSVITVADNFTIQDVDVLVKVQHTWRNDAILTLQGPDGTLVPLTGITAGICGGEDNINAIFDDEGAAVVCNSPNLANLAATPDRIFTNPIGGLAAFDGLPSAGLWTLLARDIVTADVGTVMDWQLILDAGDACKGACCLPNTSCIRTGQQVCIDQGGTFNGNGSQCSPSPCAPNGACCVGGTCSLQSAIDCGINSGVFGGVNSDCTSPPCFVPCCKQDGSCSQLTLAACNALPFAIPGDPGDPCAGPPCVAVGACCFEDGTCEAPRTQSSCIGPGGGGVRWTEGIGCAPNLCQGRCCSPDGTCLVVFPEDCIAPSEYGGDGTNCSDPLACQGRCCSPDGTCTVTGPGTCQAPSVFAGVGTDCSNPNICIGACCSFNGGECTMQGPANCQAPDIFNGLGVTCAQVQCSGRCCQAGGACTVTSPGQCTGGVFSIGQTCDPVQVFQFNEVNMFMVDSPVQTPASNVQTIDWPTPLIITDLNVDLNADHMWPGDVQLTLSHQGLSVIIYDRPGVPTTTFGCATDDFNIILDDEGAGGPIETVCNALEPSALSPPNYVPANPLDAFDGMDALGEWTITSIDFFDGDNGTLLSWSLHVGFNGQACPTTSCTCFGDMNGDGAVSGRDVNLFAQCVAAGGAGCPCGDMNHAGGATSDDVPLFVTACLNGTCGAP